MSTQEQESSARFERAVRFTYAKPGTQPPIYVAGTFTTPQWEPQEMSYTEKPSPDNPDVTEFEFHKEYNLPEGTWQYKFRIGSGDWWTLDERADTVVDEAGYANSVCVVRREDVTPALSSRAESKHGEAEKQSAPVNPRYLQLPSHDEDGAVVSTDEESPPLYEEHTYAFNGPSAENMETPRPQSTSKNPFFDGVDVNGLTTAFDEALRHEPDEEIRPEHAPLFAHECLSSCDEDAGSVGTSSSSSSSHHGDHNEDPADVEVDESQLERFPSDGQDILKYIVETESRLEEDVTSDDDSRVSSPVLMPGTPVDTVFARRHSPPSEHSPVLENIPEENDLEFDASTPEHMTLDDHVGVAMPGSGAVFLEAPQPKSARHVLNKSGSMPAMTGAMAGSLPAKYLY